VPALVGAPESQCLDQVHDPVGLAALGSEHEDQIRPRVAQCRGALRERARVIGVEQEHELGTRGQHRPAQHSLEVGRTAGEHRDAHHAAVADAKRGVAGNGLARRHGGRVDERDLTVLIFDGPAP